MHITNKRTIGTWTIAFWRVTPDMLGGPVKRYGWKPFPSAWVNGRIRHGVTAWIPVMGFTVGRTPKG